MSTADAPRRQDGHSRPLPSQEGKTADGKLTFEGPARFQYELDDRGRIKTNGDGTIRVTWWLRDENGQWAPWMHNRFTKAGP